jgi:hypothetical protein
MKEPPYNLILDGADTAPNWTITITGHQASVSFILAYLERENSSGNQVFDAAAIGYPNVPSFSGQRKNPSFGVGTFRYASELVVSIIETVLGFEPVVGVAWEGDNQSKRYWRRTEAFTGI